MKDIFSKVITLILVFAIVATLLAIVFLLSVVLFDEDSEIANTVKNTVGDVVYVVKRKINESTNNEEEVKLFLYNDQEKMKEELTSAGKNVEKLYYYNQLDNNAKIIYTAIDNNLDKMKSGTYKIELSNIFDDVMHQDNGETILNEAFQSALNAFSMDRMDIFYIDFNKVCLYTETTKKAFSSSYINYIAPQGDDYYSDGFTNKQDVDEAVKQINSIKKDVVNNSLVTDYEKVKYIHNWLIDKVQYENVDKNSYNIYGIFINQKAVCEGYARAFKYLIDELEVPCVFVTGVATNSQGDTENHAWNYVKLNDKWYAIDTTWDDPIVTGGGVAPNEVRYKYFCKGSDEFNINHTANGGLVKNCNKVFEFPTLEKTNFYLLQ